MKRADITDRMVCEAVRDWQAAGLTVEKLLMTRTGAEMKVVYAAMERADDRGYTDFGVSLRTAWLTPKGEALLRMP